MERNPRIKSSPIRLSPRSHHPSSRALICRQNLITWQVFLIILSLASLDRPWLFLDAKKFSTRCLFIFVNPMILRVKHGSRKPQDWQQPKPSQESREVQEESIFLRFEIVRQTQKD
ncbi:hypothetical protein F2Q69_00059605 [Brassica cretica]|uniref:Uncharacterized protein n=1 Tax=Brassica cretica TaxID=69181 RepID=A0A8S9RDH5_BRACR|nr:hypothetical protein F2Q69_00059605 [Brassica cretica]